MQYCEKIFVLNTTTEQYQYMRLLQYNLVGKNSAIRAVHRYYYYHTGAGPTRTLVKYGEPAIQGHT